MASRMLCHLARPVVPRAVLQRALSTSPALSQAIHKGVGRDVMLPEDMEAAYPLIGKREIVGYGMNGLAKYDDDRSFPHPAIRFREDDANIGALRQKEKGDWKNLSIEEKKTLYRAAYCQTITEFTAPNGEWKYWTYITLAFMTASLLLGQWMEFYCTPPLPKSLSEEHVRATIIEGVKLHEFPCWGTAQWYDYEKKQWK